MIDIRCPRPGSLTINSKPMSPCEPARSRQAASSLNSTELAINVDLARLYPTQNVINRLQQVKLIYRNNVLLNAFSRQESMAAPRTRRSVPAPRETLELVTKVLPGIAWGGKK